MKVYLFGCNLSNFDFLSHLTFIRLALCLQNLGDQSQKQEGTLLHHHVGFSEAESRFRPSENQQPVDHNAALKTNKQKYIDTVYI